MTPVPIELAKEIRQRRHFSTSSVDATGLDQPKVSRSKHSQARKPMSLVGFRRPPCALWPFGSGIENDQRIWSRRQRTFLDLVAATRDLRTCVLFHTPGAGDQYGHHN